MNTCMIRYLKSNLIISTSISITSFATFGIAQAMPILDDTIYLIVRDRSVVSQPSDFPELTPLTLTGSGFGNECTPQTDNNSPEPDRVEFIIGKVAPQPNTAADETYGCSEIKGAGGQERLGHWSEDQIEFIPSRSYKNGFVRVVKNNIAADGWRPVELYDYRAYPTDTVAGTGFPVGLNSYDDTVLINSEVSRNLFQVIQASLGNVGGTGSPPTVIEYEALNNTIFASPPLLKKREDDDAISEADGADKQQCLLKVDYSFLRESVEITTHDKDGDGVEETRYAWIPQGGYAYPSSKDCQGNPVDPYAIGSHSRILRYDLSYLNAQDPNTAEAWRAYTLPGNFTALKDIVWDEQRGLMWASAGGPHAAWKNSRAGGRPGII